MRFSFDSSALWRQLLLTGLLFSASQVAWAQSNLGIGTATPDASALVEMQSSSKGLLTPRLTQAQRTAIAAPATGLLVFQTDGAGATGPGFYYNAGTSAAPAWAQLTAGTGGASASARSGPAGAIGTGDNLGDHTATQALNLGAQALVGTGDNLSANVKGVGVRADGGLNIGQNTDGGNFLVGYQAGEVISAGIGNQFVGRQAGKATTTGGFNLFVGLGSGGSNVGGSRNQFSGVLSGFSNWSGNNNQFSGYQSGYGNLGGSNNQFSGYQSGYSNTTGNNNQFFGYQSGYTNLSGSNNLFSGYQSGYNNKFGNNNWAFGYKAGPTAASLTNAGALGFNALVSQSNSLVLGGTGLNAVKVGIGTTAPRGVFDVAGEGNIYLTKNTKISDTQAAFLPGRIILSSPTGPEVGPLIPTGFTQIVASGGASGDQGISFVTALNYKETPSLTLSSGGRAVFHQAVTFWEGGTFYGPVSAYGFTSISDQRLKQGIRPLGGALAAVQQMRGVRYTYRQDIAGHKLPSSEQVGFIAQELEKLYPELVITGPDGYKAVNYSQLTPVLLEAIKEQQQQVESLKTQATASTARADQAARAEATQTADIQRLKTQLARLLSAAPTKPVAGR